MTKRKRGGHAALIAGLVANAGRQAVAPGYGSLSTSMPRLLNPGNCFDGKPPRDTKPNVVADAPAYFAAASILHLEDGYSYAGRSIGALLRGDRGAATHLAYYAELRAAIALLASHGLLTVNKVMFSLGPAGLQREKSTRGTHDNAWLLLDAWSGRSEALDVLGDSLRPFGVPMSEWLAAGAIPALASSTQATAQHWLRTWSLDLKRMFADRVARNSFSYNPTRLISRPDFLVEPFLAETWQLLEPSSGNAFQGLDQYLLRMIVEQMTSTAVEQAASLIAEPAGAGAGPLAKTAAQALDAYIDSARASQPGAGWEALLRRSTPGDRDPALVMFARAPDQQPWCLLSRALILLRVAAGGVRGQMSRSGVIASSALDHWTRAVISERGLAERPVQPITDLWVDIELALAHLARCPPMNERTHLMLRQLETPERIALWALAA